MKSFRNAVVLFIQLATGRFTTQPDFDEFKNRFKFLARGFLTFPYTLHWLAFLNNSPDYKNFLWRNPRIATKLHRPYMIKNSSLKQQLQILRSHYRLQATRFSSDQQRCLLAGGEIILCQFTGKNGHAYTAILNQNLRFQKEGELALHVRIGEKSLCIISFSFYEPSNRIVLLIGDLQGPEHQDYPLVKDATKAFYGLFPKKLALEILLVCAERWGMGVQAISNEGHIYQHWRYNKAILADYDQFWQELGGHKIAPQIYELIYPIYHKPLAEIESKKRSEHKKRQSLIDDIKQTLTSIE